MCGGRKLCAQRQKNNWPTKIRSVYGISERATTHDIVNDMLLLEDRMVQMWPNYPCVYDVRATSFKSRDVRQLAMEEQLYMRSHFTYAASQHAVLRLQYHL